MSQYPHDEFAKGLLGRDKVQAQEIEEVARLPVDSPERINALELFSSLKSNIEANQPVDQEEEDLVLRLSPIYLEKIQEAEQRGEQIGSRLIIKQLQRRFGVLSADITEKISALPVNQIETLGENIFDFSDMGELTAWLNQNS
jgi:heme oxygenase